MLVVTRSEMSSLRVVCMCVQQQTSLYQMALTRFTASLLARGNLLEVKSAFLISEVWEVLRQSSSQKDRVSQISNSMYIRPARTLQIAANTHVDQGVGWSWTKEGVLGPRRSFKLLPNAFVLDAWVFGSCPAATSAEKLKFDFIFLKFVCTHGKKASKVPF